MGLLKQPLKLAILLGAVLLLPGCVVDPYGGYPYGYAYPAPAVAVYPGYGYYGGGGYYGHYGYWGHGYYGHWR